MPSDISAETFVVRCDDRSAAVPSRGSTSARREWASQGWCSAFARTRPAPSGRCRSTSSAPCRAPNPRDVRTLPSVPGLRRRSSSSLQHHRQPSHALRRDRVVQRSARVLRKRLLGRARSSPPRDLSLAAELFRELRSRLRELFGTAMGDPQLGQNSVGLPLVKHGLGARGACPAAERPRGSGSWEARVITRRTSAWTARSRRLQRLVRKVASMSARTASTAINSAAQGVGSLGTPRVERDAESPRQRNQAETRLIDPSLRFSAVRRPGANCRRRHARSSTTRRLIRDRFERSGETLLLSTVRRDHRPDEEQRDDCRNEEHRQHDLADTTSSVARSREPLCDMLPPHFPLSRCLPASETLSLLADPSHPSDSPRSGQG